MIDGIDAPFCCACGCRYGFCVCGVVLKKGLFCGALGLGKDCAPIPPCG